MSTSLNAYYITGTNHTESLSKLCCVSKLIQAVPTYFNVEKKGCIVWAKYIPSGLKPVLFEDPKDLSPLFSKASINNFRCLRNIQFMGTQ